MISVAALVPPGSGSSSGVGSAFTFTAASVIRPSAPSGRFRAWGAFGEPWPYAQPTMAEGTSSRIFAPGLLDGQICVVSGAGTGLGKATALELAGLGAIVIGCGRRSEPLEAMVQEVTGRAGKAEF